MDLLGIKLQLQKFIHDHIPEKWQHHPLPEGFFEFLQCLIIFIGIEFTAGLAEGYFIKRRLLGTLICLLLSLVIVSAVWFFYLRDNPKATKRDFINTIFYAFLATLLGVGVTVITSHYVHHASLNQDSLLAIDRVAHSTWFYYVIYLILTCVVAPTAEEIMFRYWILNWARRTNRNWLKPCLILISMIGFIIPHIVGGSWILFLNYVPITCLLTFQFYRSGNLYRNILAHGLYNLILTML